jgi:hypothetical protein
MEVQRSDANRIPGQGPVDPVFHGAAERLIDERERHGEQDKYHDHA